MFQFSLKLYCDGTNGRPGSPTEHGKGAPRPGWLPARLRLWAGPDTAFEHLLTTSNPSNEPAGLTALPANGKASSGMNGKLPSDGRSARAERKRRDRRRQVLDCALAVFSEKGYHDSSISDIVERAAIARGTFYLYFENKRAVFEELLDTFIQRIAEAVQRVNLLPGEPEPMEQIRQNVVRVVDALKENAEFTRLLLRQAVGLDTEFDQRLFDFYGKMVDIIEHALVLGQEMGLVRPCHPRVTAACILGSVKEVANQYLLDPQGPSLEKNLLADEILTYALKGVFLWDRS